VTSNAAAVLAAAGLGPRVPLAAGAARPLLAEARVCPAIHGASGLCTSRGPFVDVLPRLTRGGHAPQRLDQPAAVAIAAAVRAAAAALPPGDRVAVVATGALTNIALLLSLYPDLEGAIAITFMGGSTVGGNTHPVSEFNIQVDPHAAAAVLAAGERGVPVTMVPLDVTHRALVTPAVLATLGLADPAARAASPLRAALADVLLYFASTYAAEFGFAHPPLHDPLAVFAAFAPASVTKTRVRIDVETASPLCAGQTVVDGRGQTGRPPNAWLVTDADFDAFWGALGGALGRAADVSPL
jgi:inosine-uridine nucleoside N-ribohydrolase